MELRERGEKVDGVEKFSILNKRLINIEWKLEQQDRKYKELQNNQYRESRDTLAVILDKLNVLENKIECLNQKSETIETDMRLVRNISQEQSRNLQGTNSGNVNELGDGSGAQVVTLNARGE